MNHQGSQSICLSVILIDSAFRNRLQNSKHYFLEVFLEEYMYITKEKKMSEYITDDRNFSR